ncbi:uncharacterized protein LOC120087681 [Benincasa hispida]|uniref:uncharacterized protein LOC120087681 n=1 Tax=Benincasa hispida TaxID=102211 RepID=UPI001901CBC6|nr:uncharacterized protein LOC120087681 [Benincasa hispida]
MNCSFQGRHPPAPLATLVANRYYVLCASENSYWLNDSGCNTHVTSDLSQLASASEDFEDDNVVAGQIFGQNTLLRTGRYYVSFIDDHSKIYLRGICQPLFGSFSSKNQDWKYHRLIEEYLSIKPSILEMFCSIMDQIQFHGEIKKTVSRSSTKAEYRA